MTIIKRQILRFKGGKLIPKNDIEYHKPGYNRKGSLIRGVGFVSELGFTISIPLVGGVLLGTSLDNKFNSYPKMTLSLLFLGILISFINLYIIIKDFSKKN